MPRFFIDDDFACTEEITAPPKSIFLTGEDASHLVFSLRARVGEKVTLCTPSAVEIDCRIDEISVHRKTAEVRLVPLSFSPCQSELPVAVTVFQAVPKGKKVDFVLQKCTELGAAKIVLVTSDYSIPEASDADKKLDRYGKIVREAAMQSQRGKIPALAVLPSVDVAIKEMKQSDIAFFCYEKGGAPLRSVLSDPTCGSLSFFIGPEGGISEREAHLFEKAGICAVSLGGRILRTETAPLAVLSAILYEYQQ